MEKWTRVLAGVTGACVLMWAVTLGAETRWVDIERSTVTIHLFSSAESRAAGGAHMLEAPLAEGRLDDTDMPHLALVIEVGQLRVVDPERSTEERQSLRAQLLGPQGLDVEQFSRITYHSLAIDQFEAGVWIVRGELEMHGRFLPLDVRTVRRGDRFTGTTTLSPADFGIRRADAAETVTPADAAYGKARVDFEIVLEAP